MRVALVVILRRPDLSLDFATLHDNQIWDCFCSLVGVDPAAHAATSLPLAAGGLGLRSAVKLRYAAHWASWADSMKMIRDRHPEIARVILDAIHDESDADSIQALFSSAASVRDGRRGGTRWRGGAKPTQAGVAVAGSSRCGVTKFARHQRGFAQSTTGASPIPVGALAAPFLCMPVDRVFRIDPQPSRILLLRRLRMPLPLTVQSSRDRLGHHRSACGISARKGFPLENAAALICREAGGQVRANVLVRDLDLHPINNLDSRRLEVVVDGLSLFRGTQLAMDNTLVSLPVAEWDSPSTVCHCGWSCHGARQNPEGETLPEARWGPWEGSARGSGGRDRRRFSSDTAQFLNALTSATVRDTPLILKGSCRAGSSLVRDARVHRSSLLRLVSSGQSGQPLSRMTATLASASVW